VTLGTGIVTHIGLSYRQLMYAKRDSLAYIKRRVARILVYGRDEIGEIIVNPKLVGGTMHVMSTDWYKPAGLSAAEAWLGFLADRIGTSRPDQRVMDLGQLFGWLNQGVVSDYFDEFVLVNDLRWNHPDPESFFPEPIAFRARERQPQLG
jgi:hypothetical protein